MPRSSTCGRSPLQCIVPPYMLERLARCEDGGIRDRAIAAIARSAAVRAVRSFAAQGVPGMMAVPSPTARKHRLVYDAKGRDALPGTLVRSEGEKKSDDPAVNEAYDHAGSTYDFYRDLFGRNSLDDAGMTLISSVQIGRAHV